MGYGKQFRLKKIFGTDESALVLPIDHGISLGDVKGLEDPANLLRSSLSWEVDAHLATAQVFEHAGVDCVTRDTPARLLTCDAFYESGHDGTHVIYETIEKALRMQVDAVKLLFMWGTIPSANASVIKAASKLMREADHWDIPVILEPLLHPSIELAPKAKLSLISDAVRVSWELGADILKIGYPGDDDLLARWVQTLNVPMIMLGGPQSGTLNQLLREIDLALKTGIRGVAVGRKVWQRTAEDVPTVVGAVRDLVHKKINLVDALKLVEHIS